MNRILKVAALTLGTLTLPATAPAFADHRGPGDHHSDGEFGERLAEHQSERLTRALDLTDAQQAKLETLQTTLADTIRPLFDSMRDRRDELETLLDTPNPDPAAVGAKAIALHRAKAEMKSARDTFEAGIVAMLDETQRAQYQALQDARPDRDERRDRRPFHGSGDGHHGGHR
jgi:Spy/CpxP family protein refolding chaperone